MPVIHILIGMFTHSVHVERNYISRRSIVSRRTRVRNYVQRDVDILRHPDSLTNKLPELVSKLLLSIPVLTFSAHRLLHTSHYHYVTCTNYYR